MKTSKLHRLTNIKVDERSLVDRAANLRRFLVIKRNENEMPEKKAITKGLALDTLTHAMEQLMAIANEFKTLPEGEDVPEELSSALSSVSESLSSIGVEDTELEMAEEVDGENPDIAERVKAFIDKVQSGSEANPELLEELATLKALFKGLSFETTAKENTEVQKQEEKIETASTEIVGKVEETVAVKETTDTESVEKLAKAYQASTGEIAELRKQLKDERDMRVLKECVQHVEKSYSSLPGADPQKLGELFKNLSEKAPEELTQLEELLKAANETISKSVAFTEIGNSKADVTSDVMARLNSEANQLVQKGEFKSKEQARVEILNRNKDLYADYLAETTGR